MAPVNPLGIIDFDYIHFTVQDSTAIDASYDKMGFSRIASGTKDGAKSHVFGQGAIRIIISSDPPEHTFPGDFLRKHGDGVCTMAFRVENAHRALQEAVHRGAKMVEPLTERSVNGAIYRSAAIKGFGSVKNVFLERPPDCPAFLPDFDNVVAPAAKQSLKHGLDRIDHLTNNVPTGEMDVWVEFYKRIFGFQVVRQFDIKGIETGLFSKVVASHDRKVIIPINEPQKMSFGKKGQIEEFLEMNRGHGVQHIAFQTRNLIDLIENLQSREIQFLDPPKRTYYEFIPKRVQGVKQPMNKLQELGILVDGDDDGYLLQLFSKYMVGPLFYEFIQREKHDGFGEGNFQALFDSIEADQRKRGII